MSMARGGPDGPLSTESSALLVVLAVRLGGIERVAPVGLENTNLGWLAVFRCDRAVVAGGELERADRIEAEAAEQARA
jgi:hypothetical protein